MTSFHLIEQSLPVMQAAAWLAGGGLIGAFYFLMLNWNVRMLARGRPPLLAMALQLGRFVLLAGVFAFIARHFGALALIMATAGMTAARIAAVRLGEQT